MLKKYDRKHAQILVNEITKNEGIIEKINVCELPYCDIEENIYVICVMTEDMTENVLDITLVNNNVIFNVLDNERAAKENLDYNLFEVETLKKALEYAKKLQ